MTPAPEAPLKILFVCIGNACRSQMAEAWARHFGKPRVEASSAGTFPLGSLPTDTVAVMAEKGVNLDGQSSKGLRQVTLEQMDVVVNMGNEVEYPMPAGFKGRLIKWEIPDPFGRGVDNYRNVRDMIEMQVLALLADVAAPDVAP